MPWLMGEIRDSFSEVNFIIKAKISTIKSEVEMAKKVPFNRARRGEVVVILLSVLVMFSSKSFI